MQTILQLAGPIATIIASFTAGGIAVWLGLSQVSIATLQAKASNDKLVLDLFDRRLKIYSDAREIVGAAVRHGTSTTAEQFDFLKAIDGASFLFGKDVTDYLNGLYEDLVGLQYAEDELKHVTDQKDKVAAFRRRTDKFEKISEFYTKAPELLAPYLAAHQKFAEAN